MSLHKEISFESEICAHLAAHGWLYAEGDAASYDRARALFPADVLAWVQATQPNAWEVLTKNHGPQAGEVLLARLRDQLDQRGTLDVLRHGIELLGLKQPLLMAQFKPALAINADILARYAANRLRVVRQVHYSQHNENSLDLVLFLNGIPVATAELKTDFTQSIGDAIDQYRFDRHPRPKGQTPEPLLGFPSGALVYFAVSNTEVAMITRLAGAASHFLPFNQGDHGAAGNPVNPKGGHRTAYLWEQVWARESWLEILGRYLIAQRDKKKQIQQIIFPRYHQLDVTRALQAAVLRDGPGGKYLIQHSAGSGKTNSIAWTAHFFAELHDAQAKKVFDTVLVVSDRTVIDSQLQEALFDFQRTSGVVATITGNDGSKSGELAAALSGDKKIVVCTIQTFPFALEAVRKLAATQGKRFAVIADEAHSSQSGEAILEYQKRFLGQENGETCLVELLPLPSPSLKQWPYANWSNLHWLKSRAAYYEYLLVPRAWALARQIKACSPCVVIFYGSTFHRTWACIAGAAWQQAIPDKLMGFSTGQTSFLVTKHPADPKLNPRRDYFREIGQYLRRECGQCFR